MIHIYTGNGKGKTTSAFGMAMRACGQGLNVIIFQFLKPRKLLCGEQVIAEKIKGLKLVRFEQRHPLFETSPVSVVKLKRDIKRDFEIAKKTVLGKKYDMVVLDEIINAVDQGFINHKGFLSLLKSAPDRVELILTGRGDISDIEGYADYVTLMIDKKHPFRKKIGARQGVEY
ncbi:MAG: cob(I)yrinic acid a,c-diamide adenosyltransferase [Candidatus Omnitrophica bacterium]|nr:cob(I)yrinic acid a,c-diamide adenosyltransferase [Candidatus Omnitrophota bacterium]MBU4149413.1 cob(I)yrinic acid a,c-diamide adenosyltransferase [Candidatus Omnitrophota bacterium]